MAGQRAHAQQRQRRPPFTALLSGDFPDPVTITLPKGQTPAFALALEGKGEGWAQAGIIKDAGDDPDVTYGALVIATVRARGQRRRHSVQSR